jgi:hypothetical protein
MIKLLSLFLVLVLFACSINPDQITNKKTEGLYDTKDSEDSKNTELYEILFEKDSLLFQIGFNKIDTSQVSAMTAMDFEFYHDEHGITETKQDFIKSIASIEGLPFKTWRILKKESMEVFPLCTDNKQKLYGAIQNGIHDFYQQEKGEKARKTNTAKFTHLWIIEDGDWKLKRVLSYDHQIPK